MADNGASTNGHRPVRRRKHIYPPLEQMAAEQAAAATRPRTSRASRAAVAEPDLEPEFGPEPEAPPAPPILTMTRPEEMDATPALAEDGAGSDAERVELRLSAVGMVDAGDVHFTQGALGAARADNVSVDMGAVGAAMADRVEVSRGYARSILARQVSLDRAAARVVVAADVKADRSAVMFLVARRVTGDVRVLLDWRGAVAFGAVAGLVLGLLRRIPTGGGSKSAKR
ncbi:MAG TPA: hypothetical protein VL749_02330 [Patescibacteria group bacterium]|jgi:hypothetical protein|nr:hypothetical protein [Patescibacteria group bacterium]